MKAHLSNGQPLACRGQHFCNLRVVRQTDLPAEADLVLRKTEIADRLDEREEDVGGCLRR